MAIALLTVLFGAGACSSENMQQPDSPEPTGRATLGISIGIDGSTRAGDASGNGGYEPGTGYENFLDIANDNYRIYFFDKDNHYISTFKPLVKSTMLPDPELVNNVYTYFYTFMGEVPSDLPLDFKLVVFANWEKYPEEDGGSFKLEKGVTTITDLCTHADSQFSHLTSPGEEEWLGPERLIPFYGVREYDLNEIAKDYITDGKIQGGVLIDLRNKEQALPLLRAMARVEVILDNEYATFSAVRMTKINDRGFCAPEKALLHTNYDHSYTWDTDFIRAVHLTGEDNSNDANPQPLDFKKVSARSVDSEGKTVAEKWVAYVPEYKNIETEDYTAIEVTLANPDGSATTEWSNPTRLIYFATDGSEESNNNPSQATATQAGRHDIERNNIYRFTITGMNADLKCEVDIQPFAEIVVDPFYGLDRDEEGNIIIKRYEDGTYDILDNGNTITKDIDGDIIEKRFADGSLLCKEVVYKDYIHDDSETDYEYTFEKDYPGGNMIIIRQETTGGTYHGDLMADDHVHDMNDRALFVLDKLGDFHYVTYDSDGKATYSRVDCKGDTIIQANGYQFRNVGEMANYLGTYIVKLKDDTEELRYYKTGEKVDWPDANISNTSSTRSEFIIPKMNLQILKRFNESSLKKLLKLKK